MSARERDRRAQQRQASSKSQPPTNDRIMRMVEMIEVAGVNRYTITRAAARGELTLIKLTPRAIGARASEFWRWIDSKAV